MFDGDKNKNVDPRKFNSGNDYYEDDLDDLDDFDEFGGSWEEENLTENNISNKKVPGWRQTQKVKRRNQKLDRNNKNRSYTFDSRTRNIIIAVIALLVLAIFFFTFSIKHEIFSRGKVGIKAVNYLYDFNSIDELESNLPKLESITTKSVYNKIAVVNSDKALNTYLKFKKNPVKVEILVLSLVSLL